MPSDEENADRLVAELRGRGDQAFLHVPTVAARLRISDADALAAILLAEGRGWAKAVRARGDVLGVALAQQEGFTGEEPPKVAPGAAAVEGEELARPGIKARFKKLFGP